MRDNYDSNNRPSTQYVIISISSLTVLLSAVFVLGAVCRFFKRCWGKIRRKRKKRRDVIAFQPISTTPALRKCSSTSHLERFWRPNILGDDGIPHDTEEVSIQPELFDLDESSFRPRVSTDVVQRKRKLAHASKSYSPETKSGLSRSHLDITFELEPRLYKREASLTKYLASQKKRCGTINIEIYFDALASKLQVKVIDIHQMLIKGHIPASNTYVTVKMLPDRQVQRTSVHIQSVHPDFNDLFAFAVQEGDDVNSHVLIFEVYHMDRFSTSYPRGFASLPLFQVDTSSHRLLTIPFVDPERSFLSTFHPSYRSSVTGTLLIALKYQPDNNLVVVNPVKVCNVPKKKHGTYDKNVYMKVVLRHKGTKLLKEKTQPQELKQMSRTSQFYEATFDEPLKLNVKSLPVEESDISISLNHYLFLKSSFIIGQVRISLGEPGYEATHLQGAIDNPDEQISAWYEIKGFTISTAMERNVYR